MSKFFPISSTYLLLTLSPISSNNLYTLLTPFISDGFFIPSFKYSSYFFLIILIASFSLHNKYNQDLVANSCIVEYKQNNDSTAIINRKVGVLRYEEKQSKIVLYNDKINKTELLSFTPQEFEHNVSIKYNQEQLKAIDNQIRKEKKAFVVMTIIDLLMIVIFLALSLKARGVSS